MQPPDQDSQDSRQMRQSGGGRVMKGAQETQTPTSSRHSTPKHRAWWLLFLQAIAAILLGVFLLALLTLPAVSAFEVLTLIGTYWLVSGLIAIVSGFSRRAEARWVWSLVVGVISMVAGVLALYRLIPVTSVIILAVLAFLMGGLEIVRRPHEEDVSALVFSFLNILLAMGLLLIPLNLIALLIIALGLGGLAAGVIVVIFFLRSTPSPSEELRVWIPVLLLGISLFLCSGILIFDIDFIERHPSQTVIVPQTVSVPQTVISKETIFVPQPVTVEVVKYVTSTVTVTIPQTVVVSQTVIQTMPVTRTVIVTPPACVPPATATLATRTAEFLLNGRFEDGFGADGIPNGWFAFDSGGEQVAFSYHDDTWPQVSIDCDSALIEVDTRRFSNTVPDRFAEIGQTVSDLQPGAQYQIAIVGEIRTSEGDSHTDDQSYYVEWAIDPAGGKDWRAVSSWNLVPWNHVYYYRSPISLTGCAPCRYSVSITAPSSKLILLIRLYKRWAIPANELLLNLDNVSLVGPK